MTRNVSGWLPNMIGPVEVHGDDGALPARPVLAFEGAYDDPDNDRTVIPGGTGSGGSGSNLGAALGVFKDVSAGTLRHRTIRVAGNLSGVEDPAGYSGEVHIRPVPPGHYNVRDYGTMVLDDSSSPARAANQAAVEAAIADMGPTIGSGAASYAGGVLTFPPGVYYFEDELVITRSCEIRGSSASSGMQWSQTVLCFPINKRGIVLEWVSDSADGGRADGSVLKNIAIVFGFWTPGTPTHYWARWDVSTAYAVGNVVIPAQWSKWGYAFECIDAGTSGTDDSFFPGRNMQEGIVNCRRDQKLTLMTNATPIECTSASGHGLTTGDKVIIEDALGNTAGNGTWTVTVTGADTFTLDTSVGNGVYTANSGTFGHIFDDGGCQWRLIHAHGIDIRATMCTVENVYIGGCAGNGINVTADVTRVGRGGANLFHINSPTIQECGGHGICVDGNDVNVSEIRSPNILDPGGFGMMLNPALGLYCVNPHTRDPQGGFAYWFDRCTVDAAYAEGGAGPIHPGNYAEVRTATAGSGPWDGFTDAARAVWTTGDTISLHDIRRPTVPNGYYYVALGSGTTDATTEPTWPTRAGSTVDDNGISWLRWGIYGDLTDALDIAWGSTSGATGVVRGGGQERNVTCSPSPVAGGYRVSTTLAPFGEGTGYVIQQYQSAGGAGGVDPNGCQVDLKWDVADSVWQWLVQDAYTPMFFGMYGTLIRPGLLGCPQGVGLGAGGLPTTNSYPKIASANRAPTGGEGPYLQGDFVLNNSPSAGGVFGWRCTVSGTPGTWEAEYVSTTPLSAGAQAISVLDIDWSLSGVYTKTLAAGGNTFTFSNATDGQTIIVILTGAASTVSWPSVKWSGGVAPTQTASGTDVYTFVKAGSTIYGSVVQAMA